jgi:hypothetical protein
VPAGCSAHHLQWRTTREKRDKRTIGRDPHLPVSPTGRGSVRGAAAPSSRGAVSLTFSRLSRFLRTRRGENDGASADHAVENPCDCVYVGSGYNR